MKEEFLNLDLEGLKSFCKDVSLNLKKGDIICLSGELGSGKTTFARNLINSIFERNKLKKPDYIKSPSFPILITYELNNFEIYHYDLYRILKNSELDEINIFEELNNSITLIEWPDIIMNKLNSYSFYSLNFIIRDENTRTLKHNLIFN